MSGLWFIAPPGVSGAYPALLDALQFLCEEFVLRFQAGIEVAFHGGELPINVRHEDADEHAVEEHRHAIERYS
jgi:hypothetical protein